MSFSGGLDVLEETRYECVSSFINMHAFYLMSDQNMRAGSILTDLHY